MTEAREYPPADRINLLPGLWFPFGFLLKTVSLATEVNSLGRDSRRTTQLRSTDSLTSLQMLVSPASFLSSRVRLLPFSFKRF